jgi:hypothetical protein
VSRTCSCSLPPSMARRLSDWAAPSGAPPLLLIGCGFIVAGVIHNEALKAGLPVDVFAFMQRQFERI